MGKGTAVAPAIATVREYDTSSLKLSRTDQHIVTIVPSDPSGRLRILFRCPATEGTGRDRRRPGLR
jgi:hypothetical protein